MKIVKSFVLNIISIAILSQLSLSSLAQTDSVSHVHDIALGKNGNSYNHKEKALMFSIGSANVLDTYLTAEQYKGTELRIISEYRKPIPNKKLSHMISHHGCFTTLDNRVGTGNEIGGMYKFQYVLYYRFSLAQNLSLQVGGGINAQLGALYNTRNSNNPVQMDISLHLSPSANISYRNFIGNREYMVRYELSSPLCGLMFSPNYGQSYYEIFSKGNYDHNIVPTTIFSTPSLCHSLTFDWQIAKSKPNSKIRIGYLGDIQQSEVNKIKRHHYAHMFLIGWVKNI